MKLSFDICREARDASGNITFIMEVSLMKNITTTDLAKFGYRERGLAERLLKAWMEKGLPDDFYDNDVIIMMNAQSGCVFLTNSEFQAAMFNGDKLETYYNCPYCGNEGFADEILEHGKCKVCSEEVKEDRG
ncbi:MAG: hypothetical protein V2A70_08225 [Candidatus Omnitrophota bacterium]